VLTLLILVGERFNTVCVAVFIALIGHVIMVISSVPGVIETKGAIGAFIVSLIVTGLGTGLFKANISPLVAEQYRRSKLYVATTRTGERVIVDPSLTISRVYMVSFHLFHFQQQNQLSFNSISISLLTSEPLLVKSA
jgi:POT family proton-dependent oligopeptide transporter